jgi:hypothetical protein
VIEGTGAFNIAYGRWLGSLLAEKIKLCFFKLILGKSIKQNEQYWRFQSVIPTKQQKNRLNFEQGRSCLLRKKNVIPTAF